MSIIRSYAQNQEDVYINWLLEGKESGTYVDVGANDPNIDSVTKYFYEKGWRGVHIEPIPRLAKSLVRQRSGDTVIEAGIGIKPGSMKFQEYTGADGLSTLNTKIQKQNSHRKKREYIVDVRTLDDVLTEAFGNNVPEIDFMKIDVEGYEYEVIKSNNWKKFRPTLLIIEANHVLHNWRPLVEAEGYSKVFYDGLNEYYTTDKKMIETAISRYPDFMIGPTIFSQKHIDHLNYTVDKLRNELSVVISDKETRIAQLEAEASNVRSLTKRLFYTLKDRVDARAEHPTSGSETLVYATDRKLAEIVKTDDVKNMVEYLRENDFRNIKLDRSYKRRLTAWLSRPFWRIISMCFGLVVVAVRSREQKGGGR